MAFNVQLNPINPGTVTSGTQWQTLITSTGGTSVEWSVFSSAGVQRAGWATLNGTDAGLEFGVTFVATGDYLIVRQPGGGAQAQSGPVNLVAPAFTIAISPGAPGNIVANSSGVANWITKITSTGGDGVQWAIFTAAQVARSAWNNLSGTSAGATLTVPFLASGDYLQVIQPNTPSVKESTSAVTVLPYGSTSAAATPISVSLTPKQPGSIQALASGTAYWTTTVTTVGVGSAEWAVFSSAGVQRAPWATIGATTIGIALSVPFIATGDYLIVRQPGGGAQQQSGSVTVTPYQVPATTSTSSSPAGSATPGAPAVLTADASGKISGSFVIPAGVPTGAKLVQFSGQGGSAAAATFIGRGTITIDELRAVQAIHTTTTDEYERYDPLAETFTLASPALISGVDLWFCACGTSGKTFVEIRETSNGVPTQSVIANSIVSTPTLLLGQWMRFSWDPILLDAGTEYAIVVGCDDPTTAVQVAELGQFDSSANQWVTSQPYQVGVLLSSSNGSTWTPDQTGDLAFRLLSTPTAANTVTIPLPPVTVAGCDEVVVLAAVERPTADCDCVFLLTLPDVAGTVLTVGEGERIVLPSTITGIIQWSAVLTGSPTASPRLDKDVELVWGTRSPTGTYVSRAMVAGTGTTLSVYFENMLQGTSSVAVQVAATPAGPWTPVPFVSGTQVGDGWVACVYRLPNWNAQTAVLGITLTGDARNRPLLRKLRAVTLPPL